LRKWAFIYIAAAVAVIGCGGTGSGSHVKTGGGGTVTTGIGVRLSNTPGTPPGAIELAIETGQGRAPGDLIAVIKRVIFTDNYGDVTNPLAPETSCPLTGYQNNVIHLNVDFTHQAIGVPSRLFTSYNLDFLRFDEETSIPGNLASFPEPSQFPLPYPAVLRVFPGRTTSLPVFIDDSMFTLDTSGISPKIVYDESQFKLINGATPSSPIRGFLSDFVSFNTNKLSAADRLAIGTDAGFPGPIDRVFFSGDVYAVTDGHASGSNIAMLTLDPSVQVNGLLGAAGVLDGPGGTLPHAGTYSILQVNPTDLDQKLKIVAGQGIWREHSTVLTGLSATGLNVVTFPSSNDDNMQEMVAFTQDADKNITALYFGFVDLDALTFNLYPIKDIVSGVTTGGLSGTLSGLLTKTSATTASPDLVRSGTYQFGGGGSIGGQSSGSFYVFRL
jgi:hypothetical protein